MLRRLINRIKRTPKKFILASLLTLGVVVPVTAWAAWGPSRPVFDWNDPAQRKGSLTGPVFNSFINTPTYGDERNFTTASPAGTAKWKDGNQAEVGKEMEVRVFVHNNANDSTNATNGVAKNTRVRVDIPEGVANGFDVTGYVTADNAKPQMVYDSTPITNANRAFDLEYVPGSAKIYNNGPWKNGIKLSDDVVKASGAKIGYDALNGDLPGCFGYQAVVIIKVKVIAPELEVKKQVTTPGSSDWKERMNTKVGDTVSWLITFHNKGNGVMNNVTIRDQLPKGLTIVPGSIAAFDVNRPNGQTLPDTALGAGGVNLGNYGPGGGGYVRFRTVVTEEVAPECKARNVAYGRAADVREEKDDAEVVVEDCQPDKPVYACDVLTASKVGSGNRTYRFTTEYTARNGAEFKRFVYDFGDGSEELVTDQDSVEHTYEPGEYTAQVTVVFDVNGEEKTATGQQCMVNIFVGEKPKDNCPIPGKENLPKDSPECVEQPEGPSELPKTGVGDLAGIFAATTVAGMIAYRVVLARRFN